MSAFGAGAVFATGASSSADSSGTGGEAAAAGVGTGGSLVLLRGLRLGGLGLALGLALRPRVVAQHRDAARLEQRDEIVDQVGRGVGRQRLVELVVGDRPALLGLRQQAAERPAPRQRV